MEKAYKNFFAKRTAFPRFKKKGQGDSFRYPDPKQIKLDQANGRIFLPKLGWLRYRNSRETLGDVRNATVSQSGGKWFVSIQTQREVEAATPKGGIVGIDMGIARFVTLSDGSFLAPLNSFKRNESALRSAQQAMRRKTRFSHNWKKAKARIQKIHARIGNTRRRREGGKDVKKKPGLEKSRNSSSSRPVREDRMFMLCPFLKSRGFSSTNERTESGTAGGGEAGCLRLFRISGWLTRNSKWEMRLI